MRKNKTLTSWHTQSVQTFEKMYDKYHKAFQDPACPDRTRVYYGKIATHHYHFAILLTHIQKMKIYGDFDGTTPIHPESCKSCKIADPTHIETLHKLYTQYKRWIDKLPVPMSLEIN